MLPLYTGDALGARRLRRGAAHRRDPAAPFQRLAKELAQVPHLHQRDLPQRRCLRMCKAIKQGGCDTGCTRLKFPNAGRRGVAEASSDVHRFVIPVHDDELPARLRRLLAQALEQVQDLNLGAPAVKLVAHLHGCGLAPDPSGSVVDQPAKTEGCESLLNVT